ncbi:MAG: hypothetical protein ACM3Q4_09735 [Acidobacteriota bacterium]
MSLAVDYAIGSFSSATSLSVNAAGEIFVIDQGADACIRLSIDGTELSRVQGRGWGSTEFDTPTDVSAAFPLAVFVSDEKNRRIQQFDRELNFVQTIGARGPQSSLAQETQTRDQELLARSFRPIASTESAQGELFALDADGMRVVKFTTRFRAEREFGTYASGEGRLRAPSDLCMTGDGRVAVSDGERIVFFDQFGNFLFTRQCDSTRTIRALSSAPGEILAVSPDAITVIDDAPSASCMKFIIERQMIVGAEEGVKEFRDAAQAGDRWLILTPHALLVCRGVN